MNFKSGGREIQVSKFTNNSLLLAQVFVKQDSKELSPRPLANAPKTFYSKKTLQAFNFEMLIKLLLLKGSLSAFNADIAPKTYIKI